MTAGVGPIIFYFIANLENSAINNWFLRKVLQPIIGTQEESAINFCDPIDSAINYCNIAIF